MNFGKKYFNNGDAVAGQWFEYTYDDIGNLTNKKRGGNKDGTGLNSSDFTANSLNQYTSVEVPNSLNLLGHAQATASIYPGASGGGYSSTADSITRFIYDGWLLMAELDGKNSNALIRSYTWSRDISGTRSGAAGIGGLTLIYDAASGESYYPMYDPQHNLIGLVEAGSGEIAARYEYGPFGEIIRVSGEAIAKEQPFGFSTKYTDRESGLVYFGYRYYQPLYARWLSRDPLGVNGGMNVYGFVGNNPLMSVDPLGLGGSPFPLGNPGDPITKEQVLHAKWCLRVKNNVQTVAPKETLDEFKEFNKYLSEGMQLAVSFSPTSGLYELTGQDLLGNDLGLGGAVLAGVFLFVSFDELAEGIDFARRIFPRINRGDSIRRIISKEEVELFDEPDEYKFAGSIIRDFGGRFTPGYTKNNRGFEAFYDGYPASFKRCGEGSPNIGKWSTIANKIKVGNNKMTSAYYEERKNIPNFPRRTDLFIDAPHVSIIEIINNAHLESGLIRESTGIEGHIRNIYIFTKEREWVIF